MASAAHSQPQPPPPTWKLAREWAAAGVGCSLADTLFNPLGVLRTRLQTSTAQYLAGQIATKPTLSAVAKDSVVSRGLFCGLVQPGLVAAWLRGLSYTAFHTGLYPAARDKLGDNVAGRIVAGAGAGAVASLRLPTATRFKTQENHHADARDIANRFPVSKSL